MKTATREQLVSTAKQLNRILAVNDKDAIKFGPKVKDEDLKKGIILLGEEIEATDFEVNPDKPEFVPFDADAVYTFEALGVLIPKKPAPVKKDEKGKKAPAKEKKEKKERKYTRANAIVDAIKTAGTKEELVKRANDFFVKHNPDGVDSISSSRGMFDCVIPTLLVIGIITYDKETKVYSPGK